jgi:hypothetical protein
MSMARRIFDAVIVGAMRAGSSACRVAVGATVRELSPADDMRKRNSGVPA